MIIDACGTKLGKTTYSTSSKINVSKYTSLLLNQQSPEITAATGFLNTKGIDLKSLKGKVVLIEFWTFGCWNCTNTLPFMVKSYEKFKSKGVEYIGIHTPEFGHEKPLENVQQAVNKYGITYPIVQDNNFKIWKSFNNSWWPHFFLIDKKGVIRHNFVGEGHYKDIEKRLDELLNE